MSRAVVPPRLSFCMRRFVLTRTSSPASSEGAQFQLRARLCTRVNRPSRYTRATSRLPFNRGRVVRARLNSAQILIPQLRQFDSIIGSIARRNGRRIRSAELIAFRERRRYPIVSYRASRDRLSIVFPPRRSKQHDRARGFARTRARAIIRLYDRANQHAISG